MDETIYEAILKDVTVKDYSVIGIILTYSEETNKKIDREKVYRFLAEKGKYTA